MNIDLAERYRALGFTREAHPHIVLLLSAWMNARRNALAPLRKDLKPEDILPVLPNIWLYRYDDSVGDFICRIAGERINDAWGQSLRGTHFRDIVGWDAHGAALQRWKAVLNTPSIQYGKIVESRSESGRIIAERLVLPLADRTGTVRYTVGLSVYPYRQDDRNRTPPVWDDVIVIPCAELV